LLRELLPGAAVVAVLVNPTNPNAEAILKDVKEAASVMGIQIHFTSVSGEREFEPAFTAFAQHQVSALVVTGDALLVSRRDRLVELAARYALPAVYSERGFVLGGGLISYGPSQVEAYRQAGIYVAKILKGAKPADLPVEQSVKFELVINLKTAKAIGLEVPPTLLARADEVIE
jgi:putative ABC transport system substrate-binding protein